jgi:hypothetical protein
VAPVLRLSVVLAATEVAVVVSHMLISLGDLPHAAEEVSVREIPRGVTIIFLRHAVVLAGTMVVAAMVTMVTMVAMMAVMAVMVMVMVMALMTSFLRRAEVIGGVTAATIVLVIDRATHGASDETSDGTSDGSSNDTSDETSDSS